MSCFVRVLLALPCATTPARAPLWTWWAFLIGIDQRATDIIQPSDHSQEPPACPWTLAILGKTNWEVAQTLSPRKPTKLTAWEWVTRCDMRNNTKSGDTSLSIVPSSDRDESTQYQDECGERNHKRRRPLRSLVGIPLTGSAGQAAVAELGLDLVAIGSPSKISDPEE